MQGIVTVDRQVGAPTWALWVTTRVEVARAAASNAVELAATDPESIDKVRALTRSMLVVGTEGSDLQGLPLDNAPMVVADVGQLVSETRRLQDALLVAIESYRRRVRSKAIKDPELVPLPSVDDFPPVADTAVYRALATANFVASAWSAWLSTEVERTKRTINPRTGLSPWMMPDGLAARDITAFPSALIHRL